MATKKTADEPINEGALYVPPARMQRAVFTIEGTAPYVQLRFSEKQRGVLRAKHAAGDAAKSKKAREAKDFDGLYEQAQYKCSDGANGIPSAGFRHAMIDACRVAGIVMTQAKMSVFVEADDFDNDGTGLTRITHGKPRKFESITRNAGPGAQPDIRVRAMWEPGWQAVVRVRFDADRLSLESVTNLLSRAGEQVGVGEGRPYSKNSPGMGWGTFTIVKVATDAKKGGGK